MVQEGALRSGQHWQKITITRANIANVVLDGGTKTLKLNMVGAVKNSLVQP